MMLAEDQEIEIRSCARTTSIQALIDTLAVAEEKLVQVP